MVSKSRARYYRAYGAQRSVCWPMTGFAGAVQVEYRKINGQRAAMALRIITTNAGMSSLASIAAPGGHEWDRWSSGRCPEPAAGAWDEKPCGLAKEYQNGTPPVGQASASLAVVHSAGSWFTMRTEIFRNGFGTSRHRRPEKSVEGELRRASLDLEQFERHEPDLQENRCAALKIPGIAGRLTAANWNATAGVFGYVRDETNAHGNAGARSAYLHAEVTVQSASGSLRRRGN